MKVKMKAYEKKALDFASQYKGWELRIAAKAAYIEAYKEAIKDLEATGDYQNYDMYYGWSNWGYNFEVGNTEVEVEFPEGSHQLSPSQTK